LGLSFNGAAAECFVLPESRLVAAPETLPAAILALAEPLSVAYHAVKHLAYLDKPANIVVSGPGPIGLMAALLLVRHSHRVVLLGADRDRLTRLAFAASLGIKTLVSGENTLPFEPDGWLEASGAGAALNAAGQTVKAGGMVVVPGLFGKPVNLDFNAVVRREVRLQGSYGSVAADYRQAIEILKSDLTTWNSLVTQVSLGEGLKALERTAAAEVVKMVMVP
jgi:L-iditol 2-dehydrogenase